MDATNTRNLRPLRPLANLEITRRRNDMRALLSASVLAIAALAISNPASAQFAVDTPLGGVRVGPERHYYSDYDRPAYRAYGYDRGYHRGGCRTVTIERDDGSVRRIRRCD